MNVAKEVFTLLKAANIPIIVITDCLFGVNDTAFYTWMNNENHIPPKRKIQLEKLRDTLKYYLDKGVFPVSQKTLIWNGIIHLTECSPEHKT